MKLVKKNKGFTLIELVAVVAIIGILAALLVPKISGYIQDAKKTKVIDQARKVVQAVETANIKNDTIIEDNKKLNEIVSGAANKTINDAYNYITGGEDTKSKSKDSTESTTQGKFKLQEYLPNLKGDMTIGDCKLVTEGKEFTIDKSGVFNGFVSKATR